MINKIQFSKIFPLVIGMAILTQPAMAYVSEFGLPTVGTVSLGNNASIFWVSSHQKYNNNVVYQEHPSQKNVEESIPDGAEFMISSVPIIIQNQVTKNIFTANIPNDQGGYSTVILQKSGNRFIELLGELYPEIPLITQ